MFVPASNAMEIVVLLVGFCANGTSGAAPGVNNDCGDSGENASAVRAEREDSLEAFCISELTKGRSGAVGGTASAGEAGGAGDAPSLTTGCPATTDRPNATDVADSGLGSRP